MKHLLLIFSISLLAFASGCTKGCSTGGIGCSIEKTVVSGVGNAIASQLQCSNEAGIEADLQAIIGKLNLCKEGTVSSTNGKVAIPGVVCSIFADLVINGVAGTAIPSAWGCSAANAKALLKNVVVSACQGI